jgi:hypothetical protein
MSFIHFALVAICILFSLFMAMDWYSILAEHTQNPYSFWVKYCVTLICVMVAWKAQSHSISPTDTRLLRAAFLFVAVADFFLVVLCGIFENSRLQLAFFAVGVIAFTVVQILLIIRHVGAICRRVEPSISHRRIAVTLRIVTAVMLYTPGLVATVVFWPHIAVLGWFAVVGMIYAFLLLTSVWAAWGAVIGSLYSSNHSLMIAIGMTFFLFCDLCVGSQLFFTNWLVNITSGLVWLFYTPALLLLAISGCRFIEESGNL